MTDDDSDLFFKEMQGVTPLRTEKKVERQQAKAAPTPGQLHRKEAAQNDTRKDPNYLSTETVDYVQPDAILSYKIDGVQNGVFKNLRLGKYPVQARLDLHRKTVKQARQAVFNFINECLAKDHRTVIIIHGKGEQSQPQPALLKSYCNIWLQQIPTILAFHSAQKMHGGLGATYVILRKSENKKQENRERHQKR